jgi:hypothetical protein
MNAPCRVLDLSFNPLGKWDNSPLEEAGERLKGLEKLEVRRDIHSSMCSAAALSVECAHTWPNQPCSGVNWLALSIQHHGSAAAL